MADKKWERAEVWFESIWKRPFSFEREAVYESLKTNVVKGTDTLAILPTGYGKSMIYQLLSPVFDFVPCVLKDTWELGFGRFPIKSSYARPVKLRASGMRICIWKDDKVSNLWNNCIYPDRTPWCLVLLCLHTQAGDEPMDSLEQDNVIGYQVTFRAAGPSESIHIRRRVSKFAIYGYHNQGEMPSEV